MASETALFDARTRARQGQKDLYASNIRQFQKQIDGLNAEIQSKASQLTLIASELSGVQELYGKGLVPLTRLTTLQRDSAQLEGERAQLAATVAETNAKIGQARLQITQIDQEFRSEVMKDLRESQDKQAELIEKNVAAKDQLDRIEIRAPTSGIIHELAVHTIGGVVRPGDVIMEIVPDTDALEIEGHLPPNEIDQVGREQRAYLRFSTLDRPTMPEVRGTVTCFRRLEPRRTNQRRLLYREDRSSRGRTSPARRHDADLGDAGGDVPANGEPHNVELSVQTDRRPASSDVQRAMTRHGNVRRM